MDVIRDYGYLANEYSATTEDGYILTLTRIQSNGNKMPVLIIHGVLATSEMWIVNGPSKSLGESKIHNT